MNGSLTRKIGFWSLVSIVISSQVGSGILVLPASLSSYGAISIMGWLFSGFGAIMLALVFAELAKRFPETGGPHVFVQKAFGQHTAFFIAWSYWIISWLSTSVVIIAAIGYIGALFNGFDTITNLILQIILLSLFTLINMRGVVASGYTEIIFTILKIIPLIILPVSCLYWLQPDYFTLSHVSYSFSNIGAAALTTFWGFIGIESATTPAGSVENANKTIPRAIVVGTMIVGLIYIISSVAIMGIVPPAELRTSTAPFADAAKIIFGGEWYYIVSFAAAVICLGTLNAWILISGQIALGAAKDKLFPAIFAKTNGNEAPYISILIASFGMIPVLFLTMSDDLVEQFTKLLDMSVSVFIIIYMICTLSLIKIIIKESGNKFHLIVSILSLIFCSWILLSTGLNVLIFAVLVFATGIPIYLVKITGRRP